MSKFHVKKFKILLAFALIASNTSAMSANSNEIFTMELQGEMPLSLSILIGVLNGEAEELVYGGSNTEYLSKLNWNLDNVPMIGLEGSWRTNEKLSLNFSAWNKINDSSGNMEDYDWLDDTSDWTHFTSHDTELDKCYMLDANMSYIVYKNSNYLMSGQLGFRYDQFKWTAYDGSGTYYGVPVFIPGKNISYDQELYTPYLGAAFSTKKDKWLVDSYVRGSLLSSGEATDNHFNRKGLTTDSHLVFVDEVDSMNYLSVGINIGYLLRENLIVNLSWDYQEYFEERGTSTKYDSNTGELLAESDVGGMANNSYMISLGATYLF